MSTKEVWENYNGSNPNKGSDDDLTMNAGNAARTVQEVDALDDLDPECFETFEDVKEELEEVERNLATRFKIRRHVRRELIVLDRANKLVEEDDLVARWHELYTAYVDWVRSDTEVWDEEPPLRDDEASPECEDNESKRVQISFWTPRITLILSSLQ